MRWIKIITVLVLAGAVLITCAADIVLPDIPNLKGSYTGVYTLTLTEGASHEVHQQNIVWIFTDTSWHMNTDPDSVLDDCFCEYYGSYALENRVVLDEQSPKGLPDLGCDTVGGQELCVLDWGPEGAFDLRRPEDSVILSRSVSAPGDAADTLKVIILIPVSK